MPNTLIKIASTTVGSGGAASVDFNDIPQTYTDLLIKGCARTTQAGGAASHGFYFKINTATTNRTGRLLYSTGATLSYGSPVDPYAGPVTGSSVTANYFSNNEVYINNYTSGNNKTYISEYHSPSADANYEAGLFIGMWSQTAAITSLSFYPSAGSFVQYTTVSLYGILRA